MYGLYACFRGEGQHKVVDMRRNRGNQFDRVNAVVAGLELPPAVFKTCPWQPRELVDAGLRQWLRCCAAALHDRQIIGMPSHAVDEAWHGFILCTARYAAFCGQAYGEFLHHHPEDAAPEGLVPRSGSSADQLRKTVIAWTLAAMPGEQCVLWDLDERVGVDHPWGLDPAHAAAIEADVQRLTAGVGP